jgi:SMI1-KNR4 cell-wall
MSEIIDSAYQQFCTKRFGLPNQKQLVDLEKNLGVVLSEDYKTFILSYNGGRFREPRIISHDGECPLDRLTVMYGIGASHPTSELGNRRQIAILTDKDPPKFIPIGYTIMGYFIILSTRKKERGFIFLKTFDEFFFLADSIEGFFQLLHEPPDE